MSGGAKSSAGKTTKPTAEEVRKAKEAAAEKARQAKEAAAEKARLAREEQTKSDQAWLDENAKKMSADEQDELYRQASANCKDTTKQDGKIVLACPILKKLDYCVKADPFSCPNGKSDTAAGCKLSPEVSKALRDDKTCIEGGFVSNAEGGSYMSPYVPWGPISGATKDGKPVITAGNSSGVTIGTGVDLGAVSDPDKYLKRLEDAGVSQETRDKLKPFLGKKKADACKALREAKKDGPIVLPPKDVELIDLDAMQSRVPALKSQFKAARDKRIKTLNSQIKKEQGKKTGAPDQTQIAAWQKEIDSTQEFGDLTCSQQTILFSTLYHEGSINKPHSKAIVDALLSGDDDAARAALVAKTGNANKLIASRGKSELSFFDEGE
jgi:hypothetical protein